MSEFAADPYPFYARLRRDAPVHFVPSVGMWWVTRHRDVATVLQDPRFRKEAVDREAEPPPPTLPPECARFADVPPSMIFRDPPDHTRLRALVSKAFTPRTVERLRPHIEDIAAELLDRAAAQGRMDVAADFAFPRGWWPSRRPEILPSAVEELLRWTSPVQGFARNVAEDVELGGKVLRRGDRVSAVIAAANRDPEVFADPERLDVTRREPPHLAFGRGIHLCLGARLRIRAPNR